MSKRQTETERHAETQIETRVTQRNKDRNKTWSNGDRVRPGLMAELLQIYGLWKGPSLGGLSSSHLNVGLSGSLLLLL